MTEKKAFKILCKFENLLLGIAQKKINDELYKI
jgi:hypothetical protein